MRATRRRGRGWFPAVGAALVVFGAVVIAMLPAAAAAPRLVAPSTGVLKLADAPNAGTATTTTTTGGIVQCPSGDPSTDTCANLPCTAGQYCGTVVAGPTQDLGPGQFVYLSLSGFAPADTNIVVYYCSDPGGAPLPAPGASPPVCGSDDKAFSEAPQVVSTWPSPSSAGLPSGTASTSIQAAEVSSLNPLDGHTFNPSGPNTTFFCDGSTANACDIVITDASIDSNRTTSSANSIAIPITFAPSTSGCPNGSVVSTQSEFGIDVLMPLLARLSCQSNPSTAIIPDETAVDGLTAVTNLASSQFPPNIAFTDDPEAADQQAQLHSGPFALIPVALTANVVGYFAQLFTVGGVNPSGFYPLDQMDLTPTMAAGLLTEQYQLAQTADDVVACSGASAGSGSTCLGPKGPCFGTPTCSLYTQLNYVYGFNQFQGSVSVQRSDNAGATDQLFNWLCNAPIVPLDFGSTPTESKSGAQLLKSGLTLVPSTSCPVGVDQVPPYGGTAPFITANGPNQQALKTYNEVFNSGISTGSTAGFADLNWAEARYYGMSIASLQNATGAFVAPSQASLDAAVAQATPNADGSLTPQNEASGSNAPAAYPMPSIIYAVVNTTAISQSQAAADTTLLTQLLDLTGGSNAADLPDGFVPLPQNLVAQAKTDIANDINVAPVSPGTGGGGGAGSGAGGAGGSSSSDNGLATDLGGGAINDVNAPLIPGLSPLVAAASLGINEARAKSPHHLISLLGPALPGYALVAGQGSAVEQVALVFGIAALAFGAILMGAGALSRRRLASGLDADGGEAAADPDVAELLPPGFGEPLSP